jgi:DNA-binding Lrp family transcriptional regulator
VHNRIKRLEKLGIIRKYSAEIDWKKAGKPVTAFVLVSFEYILPTGGKVQQEDAAKEIRGLAGVEEVSILAGGADMLVKVRAKDLDDLNDFVVRKLRNIAGVDKSQTMIVLSSQ